MDEPIHDQENRFWDHVADWIVGTDDPCQSALSSAEIEEWMEEVQQDFKTAR